MGTSTCLCLVWNSKFHSPDPGWSNTRRGLLLNIPSRKSGLEVIVVITMHCFKILRSWGPDGISGVCDMLHVVSIMQLLLRINTSLNYKRNSSKSRLACGTGVPWCDPRFIPSPSPFLYLCPSFSPLG